MNILILGAGGMLGHKCVQLLRDHGHVIAAMRTAPPKLPDAIFKGADVITNVEGNDHEALAKLFEAKKPDVVINAMGIIKQRDEAKETGACISVNASLPHYIAHLCEQRKVYFITLGTDCVFPCEGQGPYKETDRPDPHDLYGKSKLLGEVARPNCLTLRMSIVGRELGGPKRSLFEWIFANQGKTVQGFRHAFYSGMTTIELTRIIAALIQRRQRLSGVWHVAGPYISKYDLLLKVNEVFKLGMTIKPQDDFVCDRRLDSSRFHGETEYEVPSWEAMLEAMRAENSIYTS